MDKFTAEKRKKEHDIAETERTQLQDWAERESVIAARAQTCQAYRAQIEAFPHKLDEAVEKAREEASRDAGEEAQIKTDLYRQETKANRQVRELEIQALLEAIARQTEQREALSAELKGAIKQAQALAFQAIGGAAGAEMSPADDRRVP